MRPRKSILRRGLPKNLYERNGYYSYKDPELKVELGLGRDRKAAIDAATARNALCIVNKTRKKVSIAKAKLDDRGLVDRDFIVNNATKQEIQCGIYFLIKGGEIVYIGKSIDCASRLISHRMGRNGWFDAYFVIPAEIERLDGLEAAYIAKFNPPVNKIRPADKMKKTGSTEQEMQNLIRMGFEIELES